MEGGYKAAREFELHPQHTLRRWERKLRRVSYFGNALHIQTVRGQFLTTVGWEQEQPVYVYGEQLFELPEGRRMTDAFSSARKVSPYWHHHGGGALTLLRASLLKMQLQIAGPEQELEDAYRSSEQYLRDHGDLAPLEVEKRLHRPRRRDPGANWTNEKASQRASSPSRPGREGIGIGHSRRHLQDDMYIPYDPHRPYDGARRRLEPVDDALQPTPITTILSSEEDDATTAPPSSPEGRGVDREAPLPPPTSLDQSTTDGGEREAGAELRTALDRHGASFEEEERNFTLVMLETEAPVTALCPDYRHIEQQDPFNLR